jgi:hypothetical protein
MAAALLINLLLSLALRDRDKWAPSGCGASLAGHAWSDMTPAQQRALVECYARDEWFNRSDGQPVLDQPACDLFVGNIQQDRWHWDALGGETQRAIGQCIEDRATVDAMRTDPALAWLPQDLVYNAHRQYAIGGDLMRVFAVVWQWDSDNREAPGVWLSARYESHWTALGLNASHYAAVREAPEALEALETFRLRHGLEDYLRWNGVAHQPQATRWLVGLVEK